MNCNVFLVFLLSCIYNKLDTMVGAITGCYWYYKQCIYSLFDFTHIQNILKHSEYPLMFSSL